jgi:hypothetical protein
MPLFFLVLFFTFHEQGVNGFFTVCVKSSHTEMEIYVYEIRPVRLSVSLSMKFHLDFLEVTP